MTKNTHHPWYDDEVDWSGVGESSIGDSVFDPFADLDYKISQIPDPSLDLPREIFDPYYDGPKRNTSLRCFHGEVPQRKVAFDMAATGRRFIGCPHKGANRCSFLAWVDDPWGPVLTRSLLRLWSLLGIPAVVGSKTDDGDNQANTSFIDILVEKCNMQIASEHREQKLILSEMKLKHDLRLCRTQASKELGLYTKICVSSISVCVTLAAVVVFMLVK